MLSTFVLKRTGKRPQLLQLLVSRFRFRLYTLFWIVLLTGVLAAWYRDRQQLIAKLGPTRAPRAGWSIDQLLGPPNTFAAGDIRTAWASALPDAPNEWVIVEFPKRVPAASVIIHETFNPGAVVQIDDVNSTGQTRCLWRGTDPTPVGSGMGKSKITLPAGTKTKRLKIRLDSAGVPGWNEIDAVGLIEPSGKTHWATRSWASSSYGDNREAPSWYWP